MQDVPDRGVLGVLMHIKRILNDVKSRFHFGRDSINYLADLLSDDLARNTARNHALSALLQVLVALRFFASGSFLEVIGDTSGLPKSTNRGVSF